MSFDANLNGNGNGNLNLNGNGNLNLNGNGNGNLNFDDNKVDDTVNDKVNVKVDISLTGTVGPAVNDLSHMHDISDSLIMPQSVTQTISNGGSDGTGAAGSEFNIDQINNLVNNGCVSDPSVSYEGGALALGDDPTAVGFHMDAKIDSGGSSISGSGLSGSNVTGASASGVSGTADAAITQSAFNQTITLGANIQFNSLSINNAGHDFTDNHHTG